jgi:hypothetical protein
MRPFVRNGRRIVAALCVLASAKIAFAVDAIPHDLAARKLALVNRQEVMLERIVKGTCFLEAGVSGAANRAEVEAAIGAYEATLPEIREELARLDDALPEVRSLKRRIEKDVETWYRFRVRLGQALSSERPGRGALADVALMENGLAKAAARVARTLNRAAAREGRMDILALAGERVLAEEAVVAERFAKHACLVALGVGGDGERMKLLEAGSHFAKLLDAREGASTTPEPVRLLVAQWRSMLLAVGARVSSAEPMHDVLDDLDALRRRWTEALEA